MNLDRVITYQVTITPDVAQAYLDKNMENQRKTDWGKVRRYAQLMRSGKWHLGDAIQFDKQGKLINGQHRLRAIILAGLPIDFLITENLEPSVTGYLDTSSIRSHGDVAAILGHGDIARINDKMVVSRDMFRKRDHDLDVIRSGNGGLKYEKNELLEWVVLNDSILERYIGDAAQVPSKLRVPLKRTAVLFACMELHQISPELTKEFLNRIIDPQEVRPYDHPIEALARAVLRERRHHDQDIALIFLSWNDWRMGVARRRFYSEAPIALGASMPRPVVK